MARVLDISFLTFVYPFSFNPEKFNQFVKSVENAKLVTKKATQDFWESDEFPDAELLPHIASYLKQNSGKELTAHLWKVAGGAMSSPEGIGSGADWTFIYRQGGREVEVSFTFQNIQLFLFRAGVGMLSFQIKPQTDSLELWQDFLYFFRYFNRGESKLTARKKTGKDTSEDFFPSFTNNIVERKNKYGKMSEIVNGIMETIDKNKWWQDAFIHDRMLPYSALFVEDSPSQNDYLLLYKLRNFFHTKQGDNPAPTDLLSNHPSLLEYSERQWFIFSLDGGNFLALDPPDTPFFRENLPKHIHKEYFHLYIIALHQRFGLMEMSHDVAEHWGAENEEDRIKAFENIRNRFLSFTARGYFTQVMQTEHHHRNYRKWQETFELQRLYDEVREEVREMFDWLQLKRSERLEKTAKEQAELAKKESEEAARREKESKDRDIELAKVETQRENAAKARADKFERRLSLFGLLVALGIGIPALIVGFFGMNITDMPQNIDLNFKNAIFMFLLTLIISILVAILIYFYMNRETKSEENGNDSQDKD